MVEIAEIADEESLKAWLRGKPQELGVLLAHRAWVRIMPSKLAGSILPAERGEVQLWRTLLLSGVRSVFVSEDVQNAADDVFRSVVDLNLVVADVANAAAVSADVIDAAHAAFQASSLSNEYDMWAEIRRDAALFEDVDLRTPVPLWDTGPPDELAKAWRITRADLEDRIAAGETGWHFWIDWYEAQLSGAPQNWDMLKEIALIPDDDWQQGAAHVNGLIEGIVEKYQGDGSLTLSGHAEMGDDADFDADHVPRQPLAQMLNRNAKTIRLQLETLASLLRDEIDVLRGRNDLSDEDRDEAQRRIEILNGILSRVEAMAGEFSDAEASENALIVVEENLPELPEEAAELAEAGGDPEVSDLIISMGASIEHLTKRGAPGTLATGIAAFDHLWGGVRRWWKKNREDRP